MTTFAVGVVVGFDWRNPQIPLRSCALMRFLRLVERSGDLRLFAVDWRSIRDQGSDAGCAYSVDVRSQQVCTISLAELDLLHIRQLGPRVPYSESLQSKWDSFLSRLAVVERLGLRCINPVHTLRYGIDKRYMLDLERAGIAVVPTSIVSVSQSLDNLRAACSEPDRVVVKPSQGECGRWVTRLSELTEGVLDQLRQQCSYLIVQPFMPEIRDGERSLYFLGDRLSHAVIKYPAVSDFRANGPHTGATIAPYRPTKAEIECARRAMAAFAAPIDIGRVDLISTRHGPTVMELEVVDPSPYIAQDEVFADRMGHFYQRFDG